MGNGGQRKGAGRPSGTGKYGEPTQAIRVPVSRVDEILKLISQGIPVPLPLYSSCVAAGFPSTAEDAIDCHLDLNEYLIGHKAATFLVKVSGKSMTGAGINDADILVVDRSLSPKAGKIVIAAIDGELTVKRIVAKKGGGFVLHAENPHYPDIEATEGSDVKIWGVVTFVIHSA